MFKSVIWSSTIDYPDELSTVLFVGKCGWNCEYCHNKSLSSSNGSLNFEQEILPRLLKRIDFIDHVVISGGECTLYKELPDIINSLHLKGFSIGIHTNGVNHDMVKKILNKLSFVGMDIKTFNYDKHFNLSADEQLNIYKSAKLISQNCPNYEFRTTLFPPYFNRAEDVVGIASWLKSVGANRYVLQEYEPNENCQVEPFTKEQITDILVRCNKVIPTSLKGDIYEDFT